MNESLCVTVILEHKDEYKPIKYQWQWHYTTDSTLPEKPLFRLLNFGVLEKDCMNQVSFLLSMHFMLLRYSFEFRPNNHALGTEGSVTV